MLALTDLPRAALSLHGFVSKAIEEHTAFELSLEAEVRSEAPA